MYDLQNLLPDFPFGSRKLLCLEINPPRGVDVEGAVERVAAIRDQIDLINVTDCALAKMKLAGLPFGAILKQRCGIEPVVNVSCRDRNLIALQADLLAGWAMGIRSIVALTGDAVTVGDSPDRKGVFEVNSIGLLNAVGTLNGGHDLAGNKLSGSPALVAGAVVNPTAKNGAAEIRRLKKKGEAGARYALSQPVFHGPSAAQFCKDAAESGVPILLGLLPFKSARAAKALNAIPGIRFPEELLAQLERSNDADDTSVMSIQHCVAIAREAAPFVAGFHVVSGAAPKLAVELARVLAAELRAS